MPIYHMLENTVFDHDSLV